MDSLNKYVVARHFTMGANETLLNYIYSKKKVFEAVEGFGDGLLPTKEILNLVKNLAKFADLVLKFCQQTDLFV